MIRGSYSQPANHQPRARQNVSRHRPNLRFNDLAEAPLAWRLHEQWGLKANRRRVWPRPPGGLATSRETGWPFFLSELSDSRQLTIALTARPSPLAGRGRGRRTW